MEYLQQILKVSEILLDSFAIFENKEKKKLLIKWLLATLFIYIILVDFEYCQILIIKCYFLT